MDENRIRGDYRSVCLPAANPRGQAGAIFATCVEASEERGETTCLRPGRSAVNMSLRLRFAWRGPAPLRLHLEPLFLRPGGPAESASPVLPPIDAGFDCCLRQVVELALWRCYVGCAFTRI
jgi:hypothetical protein